MADKFIETTQKDRETYNKLLDYIVTLPYEISSKLFTLLREYSTASHERIMALIERHK